MKGYKETSGDESYVYYLYYGDSFMGIVKIHQIV